jgi:hypothetical protein
LFYDLLGGKAQLRNEASARFEHYCSELVRRLLPRFRVHGSSKYRNGGNEVDTPDIFLADGGEIKVIIECKARRLSFEAQFSEDPGRDAKAGYEEMAKGVFQLWRHFSHARQGIAPSETRGPSTYGLVLTLDSWLAMSQHLADHVFSLAHKLADEEGEIATLDRKGVAFCSIADFEFLLAACGEDGFLRTITAASEDRFRGWLLPGIMRQLGEAHESPKEFPFDMGEVLPWWNEIPKMRPAEAG